MKDFQGKIALVTGGGKGVGRIVARDLAARGAHVLVNCFHSFDKAKAVQAEIEAAGGRADVLRASVARPDQVDRMFREVEERFGGLDVLVNNAASGAFIPSGEITEESFGRALDTNLKGSFWCARRAAPLMAKRGGGAIVNLSSVGAGGVPPDYLVVGTSKAAVESLTRYLAVEYARWNIRVNTASGGMLDNDVARLFPRFDEMRAAVVGATPLGRLGTEQDLADVVLFLASGQSRFVTGQVILADGGVGLGGALMLAPGKFATAAAPLPAPVVPAPEAETPAEEIAVVGMGIVTPGADNADAYWRLLMEGKPVFGVAPADRWDWRHYHAADPAAEDKAYQNKAGFVRGFRPDPLLSTAADGTVLELSTLWLRHALAEALKGVSLRDADRFSFLVGYTPDGNQSLEEAGLLSGALRHMGGTLAGLPGPEADKKKLMDRIGEALRRRYHRGLKNAGRFLPHRVAREAMRDLLPPETESFMVDTACSSSLYSLDLGIKGLLEGKQDVAVCGGSHVITPRGFALFSKLQGLSRSGDVRPLDKGSDGVLFSDGAGVVVLKKLSRARADGDRVLAVVRAVGCSCDGKGKAIYAPNAAGQVLAVRRAQARAGGVRPAWVVAHATGTPAGDRAEFSSLKESLAGDRPVYVTSNKSLIGHTGWTAGVASLINVLLGMREKTIPPQRRFEATPEDFGAEGSNLKVPAAPVPWTGEPRRAAVSSFGFGGTNAHVIVDEDVPGRPAAPARAPVQAGRIAVVGWSAHVPGLSRQAVSDWLSGEGPAPARSFGDAYPTPPMEQVKLPPALVRTVDRCQLMALACARELKEGLGGFWDRRRETAGVVLGHMGPTRAGVHYAGRTSLDDTRHALSSSEAWKSPLMPGLWDAYAAEVRRLVPPSNENSFPGLMPNVIPARIANYFDLKGLNAAVDAGFASSLAAFEAAARYLRSGDLDLVLAGGINGNTTPEMEALAASLLGGPVTTAEGAFIFALTTEATARAEGLPILGFLGGMAPGAAPDAVACGAASRTANYLGAEGALAALKALLAGRPAVACLGEAGSPDLSISVSGAERPLAPFRAIPAAVSAVAAATSPAAPVKPEVERYVLRWRPRDDRPVRPAVDFLAPGAVVLTDRPDLLGDLPAGLTVLTVSEPASPRPGVVHLPAVTPEAVAAALPKGASHLRILADLGASAPFAECLWREAPSLVALHDLAFLAVKGLFDGIKAGGSFISLFINAASSGAPHPFTGLFTGFVKSAGLELEGGLTFAVITDESSLAAGLRQSEEESRLPQRLPVAFYDKGARKTLDLARADGAPSAPALDASSVVVAVGGGRGITAELLTAAAEKYRPVLYLLGTLDLGGLPASVFEGSDEDFAKSRARYIAEQRAADPKLMPGSLTRRFDRLMDARAVRRNVLRMAAHSGASRVHYVSCDVLDAVGLARALAAIREKEGRIDMVVNAAGINRSAAIPAKSLEDFRAVRDLKLRSYQNLRRALKDAPPRLWCQFSSGIGASGMNGESDYASGNDFLGSAAVFSAARGGEEEFAIGWTLWRSVGMGRAPLKMEYFEKAGIFTPMSTETGLAIFMRELASVRDPFTVHLGDTERRALTRRAADFFGAPAPDFYLGRTLSRTADEAVFERVFDLEADAYLEHHRVNGFPTLPGTFVPEIAAEAALSLLPGMTVVGFEDAVFHHFLRVYGRDRPSPKKISARVLRRSPGAAVVEVRVTSDVVAPTGVLLVKDKLHFEIKALLADKPPAAPFFEAWDEEGAAPVPDPYHFPSAPVLLTDFFVTTKDTRAHPRGKRAAFAPRIPAGHPAFSRFAVPSLLLDGLARVSILEPAGEDGDLVALAAPASIRRINLYEQINDLGLAARGEVLELYGAPARIDLEDKDAPNRFCAVRPGGRVLLEMQDVRGVILGYVRRSTGAFVPREKVRPGEKLPA